MIGCIGKSAHICEGRNHVAVFFFFIHCCLNYLIALKERRLIAKLKHADLVLSRDLIMKICWAAFSDIWSIRFISSREVCESCSSRSAFSCRFTSMYSRFKKRTTKPKSTLKTQNPTTSHNQHHWPSITHHAPTIWLMVLDLLRGNCPDCWK